MRALPAPFDAIVAGEPAWIRPVGADLLGDILLTKDLAFPADERTAFGLTGLLPEAVLTIEQQVALEVEKIRRKVDPLEQYIGLAALQDRNTTLFCRLLATHLPEFLPIVYTPTVGLACQEYSHILRRTRGIWISPADRDRIPQLLRCAPSPDVRLVVVTDSERILGLGDQGAGGMPIPIGKLALYSTAGGIHPALTLPVCLDVGTDNPRLLDDPLYLGLRAPRLRGTEYEQLVEAFVDGVQEVWPGCLIQWEDFKQYNALRILARFRHRVPSFNDDVQGTAAVVLAGVLAGLRGAGAALTQQRVVLAGAGAAGVGIAGLLRTAMATAGSDDASIRRAVVLVDSRGLVHEGRDDLDPSKRAVAFPEREAVALGLNGPPPASLLRVVAAIRPTILLGTTGVAGAFGEPLVRAMADQPQLPLIMPLSNPTSNAEATPEQILRWTHGRAIVATGSPFPPVMAGGRLHEISQANNVYIFPGVGLGAIVAGAREVTDSMIMAAATTLAELVEPERLAAGALYPAIGRLRDVSRAIAVAVVEEAVRAGLGHLPAGSTAADEVDAAMWWPEYVPYSPLGAAG